MQSYRDINDSDYISDAPTLINNNFKSIASDFMGAAFPTNDLVEGTKCFRTDNNTMYQLGADLKTWKPLFKVIDGGIQVKLADKATNADHAVNADKATNADNAKVSDSANSLNSAMYATQADAEKGTDPNKLMTPARTKEAIEAFDNTPVGDVVFRPFLKDGYVKANGATVNRADYPRLVAFANANNLWTSSPSTEPWKYGRGNGSTTMVLPNYVGRFIQGGDIPAIKQAGLPEITGIMAQRTSNNPEYKDLGSITAVLGCYEYEDAFDDTNQTTAPIALSTPAVKKVNRIHFKASRSSAIYGKSPTVQPSAISLIPQIRF